MLACYGEYLVNIIEVIENQSFIFGEIFGEILVKKTFAYKM